MKKNITLDQWNQIGEPKKEAYRENLKNTNGIYVGYHSCFECGNNCLPNIGQMIEFLLDRGYRPGDYRISETICDDLWELVKEKLNQ